MKRSLPLLLLAILTFASAHTVVTGLTPAANASVHGPKAVTLRFSEPVDFHFATFRVYSLGASGNASELEKSAAQLAEAVFRTRPVQAQRVDLSPKLSGLAAQVSLPLKPGLAAGNYATLWRILSDDGHIVTGQNVFTVK